MQRRSPLHHRHLAAGARMTDEPWPQPAHYGNPEAEVAACNTGCALIDFSAAAKWEVKGTGVPGYLASELAATSAVPEALSARHCKSEDGDDYWALTSSDRAVLVTGLSVPTGILSVHTDLALTDVTSVYAQLVLTGDPSRDVLSRLTSLNLAQLGDGACAQATIARCHCTYVRLDIGRMPAYRLLVTRDTAEFVWEALLMAGRGVGLLPVGVQAWERLRGGGPE